MKRLPWLNVVLLAAVVALATLAWLRPGGEEPVQHALSTLKLADAHSIRIERTGSPDVLLDRKQGAWFLTAPLAARADAHRVSRLLEILEARASYKVPAAGLERFGLDRPVARMTIGDQAFSYGMLNTVTREQYVATGTAIYAVHLRYGTAFPASAADLASRQLLGPGEVPVRVELAEKFAVGQRGGKWVLEPASGEAGQDDLARWVDGWRLASAIHVEPHVGGKPRRDVVIELKSGAHIMLGVLASGPNTVLTRPDEKLQYHFGIETAKRLLSPPTARNERTER